MTDHQQQSQRSLDTRVHLRPTTGPRLPENAGLPAVIEAVNGLSDALASRLAVSPSVPLDARHPSASIVYSDDEYDALAARLDGKPMPGEQLRRTMAGGGPNSGR